MTDKDNMKYVWLIMVLSKKLENWPYDLSSNELKVLKLHEQTCP